jgi:hypothetical protein
MDDEKWKTLCQLIMTEPDPEKLWRLVEQLNTEFERREQQLKGASTRHPRVEDETARRDLTAQAELKEPGE